MRDILVLAQDHELRSAAIKYAGSIAALLQASLSGVHIVPPFAVLPDITVPSLQRELFEMYEGQVEVARRAEKPFRQWAADLGIERNAWHVVQGSIAATIEAAANWYDLLILDHPRDRSRAWIADTGSLLLHSNAPCILVPTGCELPRFDTVAVAWNGSVESVRALHASLPLLRQSRRVVLLHGRRVEPFSPTTFPWTLSTHIESWFEWQSLRVERVEIDDRNDPTATGAALLHEAAMADAGLLVMGAYGRTRFSEWVLGGATRHVLEQAALPLLMRH